MAELPAPGSAPSGRRRRPWRVLGIIVAAVMVVLVLALVGLQTPSARRFAQAKVTELLAAQDIAFSSEGFHYNVFGLGGELRNVTMRSPRLPDAPPFLIVDRARFDVSTTQLLRGRYVLQSGTLDGVRLHYFVNEDGVDNLPRSPRNPDEPGRPIDYLIAGLTVPNASLRYEDRARQIDVTVPAATVNVTGHALTDRHDVSIVAEGADAKYRDRAAHFDHLEADLDLGREDVRIDRASLQGAGAAVNASGTFGPFAQPVADIAVQASLDSSRVIELARVNVPMSGQIGLDGSVKGALDALTIEGRVSGSDLRFRELTGLNIDAVAAYQTGAETVRLSRLNVRGPAGTIAGNGTIAFGATGESQLSATVEALQIEPVMRAAQLPYRIASRADGRVEARWPALRYAEATGSAQLFLTPTRGASGALPVGGRIDATGNGARVVATLRNVRAAGTSLDGRVTLLDRDRLDGDLRVRAANVAPTAVAVEAFLGRRRGSLLPVRISGPLSATAHIGGRIASPVVTTDLDSPALNVGETSGIALDGRLAYRGDVIAIDRLGVLWRGARASATGTIGLRGARRLDLTVRADALPVEALLDAIERGNVPVTGIMSAQAQVGGTIARPSATVHVEGRDLVAYSEQWGALDADAVVAERRVNVTMARLEKPQPNGDARVVATGSYDLDRRAYSADVQSTNVELLSLTLPDGRPVRGGIDLTARGAGTVDDPSGEARLTATALTVGDVVAGTVTATTTVARRVATTIVDADRYGLSAKAAIATVQPYASTITADVADLDLSLLPLKLQTPLTGRLTAHAEAEGPLAEPRRGRAHVTVQALSGSWHQQPFTVEGPAELRYVNERLAIDRLRVNAQDSTLEVAGELPLLDRSQPGAITIDARGELATLARYAPVGSEIAADGRLHVTGTLTGTLEAIDPNLKIALDNAVILSPRIEPGLSNLTATATIANGEATVDRLSANWGSATLALSARVPLDLLPELPVAIPRRGGPAQITARVDGLDPSAIPGAPAGLSGRISLDAEVTSAKPDIRAAEGRIAFRDLQLGFNGLTLEQKQPSTLALRGGVVAIEQLALAGTAGTITGKGTVGLAGDRPIALDLDGNLNIAAVSLVTDRVRADGESQIDVAATGTLANPILTGTLGVTDGTLLVDEPRLAAEALNLRLDLDGNRVRIASLDASLNGGTLTGKGALAFGAGGLSDVDVDLEVRDFAFDAPLDLRSLSDSDFHITSQAGDVVIAGQVTIQEAGLTGDINFDTGLLATITARPALELTPERNPLLERILFNIDVDTATPVLVDNNLAKAEVMTDLRVVGTPYETGLLGRLEVLEGGLVTLNEHTYEVQRGQMTFIEDRRIFPSFDLVMIAEAGTYDVTLAVSGEPGNTETTLTSNPVLPEPDIMALLVTGRTLEQMRGEEYEIAREQVLSYLTGRVGSTLGRGVERATGFDEVRIEPQLIANEADPGARLSVSEDVNDVLTLTYSVDLAHSDDQIWLATYDVTRRFQTRGVRQNDNTYRFDFRHDIRTGGRPEPRRVPRVRPDVIGIAVPADAAIGADELRSLLGVKEDDEFDYFAVRDGVEDIEARLRELGFAQSRVRLDRTREPGGVRLGLRITQGPQVAFEFAGASPPEKVQDEVRLQWQRGVFDAQRTDDAAETLVEWLMKDNHLQGAVSHQVDDSRPDRRVVRFTITPGPRSAKVLLAFEGAQAIPADELNQVIDEQKLERQLFTDPVVVTELLRRLYRERGYLSAEIDRPRYEFNGAVARVVLAVREGPLFEVTGVSVAGAAAVSEAELTAGLPVAAGDPFRPAAAENALQHIRNVYWERGYNDVKAAYQLSIDRQAARAGVAFTIVEGHQSIVSSIRIDGNDKTTDRLVREQLLIAPAQPLNLRALSRSRKNLYDSGAFSIVDLSRDTVTDVASAGAGPEVIGAITGLSPEQKPVVVDVSVREVQPYQVRYGLSYDTDGQFGGVFDASAHNVLGKARVTGFAARYDRELREGRLYMSQPTLLHWPIQTTASVYYREERNPVTEISEAFNVDRRGASMQQERKLRDSYVWTYGYRFERARTFDPVPGGDLDTFIKVSPLSTSFVRETRDELLDATHGSFSSHAVSFSPTWLGSDDTYLKYFGQYFHYFPLQPERRRRFSNEIIRPRFVFATGARLGLSKGMGTFVPTSERFYAGGSTTIRGFEQNALGPIGPTGKPLGGDAVLMLNNELRFPLVSIVDGVGFLDIGNVFNRTADFSFTDLRKSAGVGVRVRTKWVLVRGDYGFVLDRRPEERRGRFYFSIGQAF